MVNTTGGSFFPTQEVVRPDGTTICGPGFPNDLTCAPDDGGTYTVIVRDSTGTFTGNYTMAFRKLNSSSGCTALSFGAAPLAGTITVAGQTDCYDRTSPRLSSSH